MWVHLDYVWVDGNDSPRLRSKTKVVQLTERDDGSPELALDASLHLTDINVPEGVTILALEGEEPNDQQVASIHIPKVVEDAEPEVSEDAEAEEGAEGDTEADTEADDAAKEGGDTAEKTEE